MSNIKGYLSQALHQHLADVAPEFFRSDKESYAWELGDDSVTAIEVEDACDAGDCAVFYVPNRGWFTMPVPELTKVMGESMP